MPLTKYFLSKMKAFLTDIYFNNHIEKHDFVIWDHIQHILVKQSSHLEFYFKKGMVNTMLDNFGEYFI